MRPFLKQLSHRLWIYVGSPADQLLLFCYEYDPSTGKYDLVIMNVLKLAGLGTVLGLGVFVVVKFRREQRFGSKMEQERKEDLVQGKTVDRHEHSHGGADE